MCNCKIEDINNVVDFSTLDSILSFMFGLNPDKLSEFSPAIFTWINKQLKGNNELNDKHTTKVTKNLEINLHNFSVAKAYHFNRDLFNIKKKATEESLAKLSSNLANKYFSAWQTSENNQTKRITETVNNFTSENKLLEYVATMENTRKTHAKAHKTILPATDPFWNNTAMKLLGEWGCNCSIHEAEGQTMTSRPNIKLAKVTTASQVDLESGKVIIFNEELDMFKGIPTIVRQRHFKSEIR